MYLRSRARAVIHRKHFKGVDKQHQKIDINELVALLKDNNEESGVMQRDFTDAEIDAFASRENVISLPRGVAGAGYFVLEEFDKEDDVIGTLNN